MAQVHESISPELKALIESQRIFFVATAPATGGHVNLSPKGLDCFRVLNSHCVAYLDATGSGNETAAHLLNDGRITFMFCAFEGKPMILRLYGRGRAIDLASPEAAELLPRFAALPGARQIILAEISRVQTSCGFAVPLMAFEKNRDQLPRWAETKGPDGLRAYREQKNRMSIDGLPTMD